MNDFYLFNICTTLCNDEFLQKIESILLQMETCPIHVHDKGISMISVSTKLKVCFAISKYKANLSVLLILIACRNGYRLCSNIYSVF